MTEEERKDHLPFQDFYSSFLLVLADTTMSMGAFISAIVFPGMSLVRVAWQWKIYWRGFSLIGIGIVVAVLGAIYWKVHRDTYRPSITPTSPFSLGMGVLGGLSLSIFEIIVPL